MTDHPFDRFAALHVPGEPLVLFNAWDAGSARAVAEGGARAIATGSWSVAAAYGLADGEQLPMALALATSRSIVGAVDLPVSVDFEGGYAVDPDQVAANAGALAATGAVGCNFEDGVLGGEGLHDVALQAERIQAIRFTAGPRFFINARTDLFLNSAPETHADHLAEAVERGRAYAAAGASGFFVPGLADLDLIGRVVEAVELPVNVMMFPGVPANLELASVGVARISHGPGPWRQAMAALTEAARAAMTEAATA